MFEAYIAAKPAAAAVAARMHTNQPKTPKRIRYPRAHGLRFTSFFDGKNTSTDSEMKEKNNSIYGIPN